MIKKGNKGEWSELYAFLKLLTDKELDVADENLGIIDEIFYPILRIIREESGSKTDYELTESNEVKIYKAGSQIDVVDISQLKTKVAELLVGINNGEESAFEIPKAEELMAKLHVSQLSAGSGRKEDITLKIHDYITGNKPEVGFSIKSRLGAPSTLLNASSATNFIFRVDNLKEDSAAQINSIDTRSKIRDRLKAIINAGAKLSYSGISSDIFLKNLRIIDLGIPEIVAQLLLAFYLGKGSSVSEIIENLEDETIKILNIPLDRSMYEIKIKNLLQSVALGMVPNTPWDGNLKATGGYIIVREDGEIVCYHVHNVDEFKSYLFKNTCLETPSSSRHEFGLIYKESNSMFIKLNFQIRFTK